VSAVLARVSWPGKPGDPAPLAPLTAVEQRRFEAGREIYQNICQACHQPDGRGQDKVAPALIGAIFTLGPAEIPARILLNGKEGAVGLMPPVGSKLTDEQIAGVLTYVRREWGQTGAPVDAGTVKTVRESTAGRRRPWTDGELMKLAGERKP
jgi:mono/diheme cytochrome c family protein